MGGTVVGFVAMIKILHVSTGDYDGGAARAAYRIHQALLKSGIDSRMRVLYSGTGDNSVIAGVAPKSTANYIALKLYNRWLSYTRRDWQPDNPILHTFGQNSAALVDELNASDADILNLHWISDMLSIADIARLRKPIVWTLHDMWPFCGGEHYAPDDESARFRQGYRTDNRPSGESGPDLNRSAWEAKRKAWASQHFTIVGDSYWLAECAKVSMLFCDANIHTIHYPLEMDNLWRPIPRDMARFVLGLPMDKKLILMGAVGGVADPRKGGDLLRDALGLMPELSSGTVELMIYGQSQPNNDDIWPCPVHWFGRVCDDRILVLAYSAADVMVVPSRQEAFGQTALEAQACGIPVVSFKIGGLPDIISHKVTGYLARPFEISDLADGIKWVLQEEQRRLALSLAARDSAMNLFSEPAIAEKYTELYEQVLAEYR